MLIAEDLLLLATDDTSGKVGASAGNLDPALGGAMLVDLLLAGRIGLGGEGRKARVVVRDSAPVSDPVLQAAFDRICAKAPVRPQAAVVSLSRKLRRDLYASLASRGVVRRERGTVLGIFSRTTWPAEDVRIEQQTRREIADALLHGQQPSDRTGAIIALLLAAEMLKTVVDRPDRKAATKRAKAIAEGSWAGDAVHKVVQAAQAATMAAVTASTAAAATSTT